MVVSGVVIVSSGKVPRTPSIHRLVSGSVHALCRRSGDGSGSRCVGSYVIVCCVKSPGSPTGRDNLDSNRTLGVTVRRTKLPAGCVPGRLIEGVVDECCTTGVKRTNEMIRGLLGALRGMGVTVSTVGVLLGRGLESGTGLAIRGIDSVVNLVGRIDTGTSSLPGVLGSLSRTGRGLVCRGRARATENKATMSSDVSTDRCWDFGLGSVGDGCGGGFLCFRRRNRGCASALKGRCLDIAAGVRGCYPGFGTSC